MKKDEELEQIQVFRTLGIIWICLGAANPLFFLLGLVLLITFEVKSKRIENISSEGGLT